MTLSRPKLKFLSFTVATLLLFVLLSCNREKDAIKIGLAINITGESEEAGENIRDGALIAVQEVNENNGIIGRPLELLIRDDHDHKNDIFIADQELIDAGVIAIIGHSNARNTITAYEKVTQQNTLLFTGFAAATALSGQNDLFFRTSVDNAQYGKALADLLHERNIIKAGVLLDVANRSFVEDYVGQTERHFTGKLNRVHINSKKDIGWDYVIRQLLEEKPEAVIMLTGINETAIAAQKIRTLAPDLPLISSNWAQESDLSELGGAAVEGLEIITFVDPQYNNQMYKNIVKRMEEDFQRPLTARSVRAYELIRILADALRQCSSTPDVQELKKQLLEMEFTTPMGQVRFDRFGDVQRPIYLMRIQDGKFIRSAVLHE